METKREDIIEVKSWMNMFETNYEEDHLDKDSIPPSGIVYCNIEWIPHLFNKCYTTDNKYVVVSGFSDFGFALQEEHPVASDMSRFFPLVREEIANNGYAPLFLPARCRTETCDIRHKYSVKTNNFTRDTVPDIPPNITKWFLSNTMIEDERVQGIPFGTNQGASEILPTIKRYDFEDKENLVYINWQNYTEERFRLKNEFAFRKLPWATIKEESDLEIEEFLDDIARHVYVICPQGNGIDTYRFWETLYLGSIPIVVDCPLIRELSGLPMLVIKGWSDLTVGMLREQYENYFSNKEYFDVSKAKLSYWKEQILSAAKGLS